MPLLRTKLHGPIDYAIGLFLGASPWLFGFHEHTAATLVALVFGAGIMLMAVLTNFRFGRWREIPVIAHLFLEGLAGVALVTAPFVLGFAGTTWIPMVVSGLAMLALAVITRRRPGPGISPLLGQRSTDRQKEQAMVGK